MKKNWRKGSSTIEASFMIPFLFFLIISVIYLSFYLYNSLLVTEKAYISALRGSREEWKSADESYQVSDESLNALMQKGLLALNHYEKQIKVSGKTISVTVKIKQKIPYRDFVMEYQYEGKARKCNPYLYIRERRLVK